MLKEYSSLQYINNPKKVNVSAPGKLMLFGEHAVVYGRPCLVTAVNKRINATVSLEPRDEVRIEAPDVAVHNYVVNIENLGKNKQTPKGVRFVEIGLLNFFNKYSLKSGINISTKSEFSSNFGFGSSSAVTVALLKALTILFGINADNKDLFDLAYKTVLDVQGVGSGFDIAAGIWGGTLYYIGGGKEITPINAKKWPLVVGYTGIKADTTTLVKRVAELYHNHRVVIDAVFDNMETITNQAKEETNSGDFSKLGELMNINQGLLDSIGTSTKELNDLTVAARSSGAWGAKLSGAGGGDCMIALVPNEKRISIERAITQAGGQVLNVEANAPGVRQE